MAHTVYNIAMLRVMAAFQEYRAQERAYYALPWWKRLVAKYPEASQSVLW
jgi:hypothetical protein